jgi:nucleoid DNA-binding protein
MAITKKQMTEMIADRLNLSKAEVARHLGQIECLIEAPVYHVSGKVSFRSFGKFIVTESGRLGLRLSSSVETDMEADLPGDGFPLQDKNIVLDKEHAAGVYAAGTLNLVFKEMWAVIWSLEDDYVIRGLCRLSIRGRTNSRTGEAHWAFRVSDRRPGRPKIKRTVTPGFKKKK